MKTPVDPNPPLAGARSHIQDQPSSPKHPDNPPSDSRGHERPRVGDCKHQGHLPRLAPECYCGHAIVHWTLAIEGRTAGWLTEAFHHEWQLCLLHSCSRFRLVCPAYVLMPDHMHLIWLGLHTESDQRLGIEFFRHHLSPALSPSIWQQQAHDHLLRDEERNCRALANAANYVFENPVRAGLTRCSSDYPFLGCSVSGYPELNVRAADYWERFWRVYNYLRAP